jgi:drug/metabolite transporter (DMT)-like permease
LVATLALSERERLLSGLVYGAVGAVLFSAKAIIVKLAYRHGADPVTLIALRMAFALPFLLLLRYGSCALRLCPKADRRVGGAAMCWP